MAANRRRDSVPTTIAIIQTRNLVRATPDGALDLEAGRKPLGDVVSAIRRVGRRDVLIDTRAAAPTRLSKTDYWALGVAASTPTRGVRAILRI